MVDYATTDNFFRNLNSRYPECCLTINDGKVYFEDRFRAWETAALVGKLYYILTLILLAFDPSRRVLATNLTARFIGEKLLILYIVFCIFMFIYLFSLAFLKIYNVIDYKNGSLLTEVWLFGQRSFNLGEDSRSNIFLILNNVIPRLINPAGKGRNSINGVPVLIDRRTNMYHDNEVVVLLKDGRLIHLWLGSTTDSYNCCINMVDFLADMWNLRKLTCESDKKFDINFDKEYDIEKKSLTLEDGGSKTLLFFFVLFIAAFVLHIILRLL